jgi:ABC-type sugar transport system ATPase subunit
MRNPVLENDSPILLLENISKAYGGSAVLTDLSFSAMAGNLTVVYGPPASGKSVLVRVLTGLEQADSGRIMLRGQDVTHEAPAERNIGYVPQSFALYPHLSVRANIAYPLDLAHVPTSESREVVAHAAAMLKIEEHLDKKPDQLSGGQKQRVAIARGIAKRTDFFVLDDPLAGLDFKLREQLVDDLRGLNTATDASILYVTSDVIEAMTLADELAVLAAGTILEHGVPEALYREPRHMGTMALVGFPPANFVRGLLERRDGENWCTTSLFAFSADVSSASASGSQSRDVMVGFRPERIHLSRSDGDPNGKDGRTLQFPASIMLREDLGGEDIVYLAASGESLTLVDRDHERGDDLDQMVMVSIFPHNLALFDAATGERVGRGARLPTSNGVVSRQSSVVGTHDSQLTTHDSGQ